MTAGTEFEPAQKEVAAAGLGGALDYERLNRLADLTLAEFVRHLTRSGESGTVLEEDGLLLFAGAHPQPNPYRNGAVRLDSRLGAAEVLERATEFFSSRGRGFALWASEHNDGDVGLEAKARGLTALETLPELVLHGLPEDLPLPDGVDLREAIDEETRRDYVQVVANAWGMAGLPPDLASRVFFSTASVDAPNVSAFVAYLDGVPVSGAMTLVTHGVALGCQAATVRRLPRPPARPQGGVTRRRGLADACLCVALERSYAELGAGISLCQTSSLGAPVWRRLGYEPFTSYSRFFAPPCIGGGSKAQ
jgi:hypothetical protein